jgi:hypothetical protein
MTWESDEADHDVGRVGEWPELEDDEESGRSSPPPLKNW